MAAAKFKPFGATPRKAAKGLKLFGKKTKPADDDDTEDTDSDTKEKAIEAGKKAGHSEAFAAWIHKKSGKGK